MSGQGDRQGVCAVLQSGDDAGYDVVDDAMMLMTLGMTLTTLSRCRRYRRQPGVCPGVSGHGDGEGACATRQRVMTTGVNDVDDAMTWMK